MQKVSMLKICLFATIIMMFFTSCSDEPQQDVTWRIIYNEQFYGVINDSKEYHTWFDNHIENISSAYFLLKSTNDTEFKWHSPGKSQILEYRNTSKVLAGDIIWVQEVTNAKESTIKSMVKKFESLSITQTEKGYFNDFKANYIKIEEEQ